MAAPNEPSFLEISETVRRLEELLDRVPDPLARDIRQKIAHLRALLLEQRSPNLVLVGRRGAGKSSLINALFGSHVAEVGHVKAQTGQGRWFDVQGELGTLSILDTRGIQEGSRPEEADSADTPLDSILAEVRRKAPDALLFLIKASEVDSAIERRPRCPRTDRLRRRAGPRPAPSPHRRRHPLRSARAQAHRPPPPRLAGPRGAPGEAPPRRGGRAPAPRETPLP
ncbi:GTPase [Archangium lansingense]|uniref:GTPase n=1 Tax=Archangium lansingense TaxID=2995310 RepID=UPI003B81983F